jgi:hypothetical protein
MTQRETVNAATRGFYRIANDLTAMGVMDAQAAATAIAVAAGHVTRDVLGGPAAAELLRDLADMVERDNSGLPQ